jgi:FkbM family methyltransferase
MNNLITMIISFLGNLPGVSTFLRRIANNYQEGSVVQIKNGRASGLLWKRYHRYVNGYWVGIYELPFQNRIATDLNDGDTFFDIGANAGFFSLIASKYVGMNGFVVAFEPLPMNADVVNKQFQINRLANCRCVVAALGKEECVCEFILPKSDHGEPLTSDAHLSGCGVEGLHRRFADRVTVTAMTLDNFVAREGIFPDLIKIDVEGAEGDVLRGGEKLLRSDMAPRILMETHGSAVAADVNKLLQEAGYRFFTVEGAPLPNGLVDRHYLAYPPTVQFEPVAM